MPPEQKVRRTNAHTRRQKTKKRPTTRIKLDGPPLARTAPSQWQTCGLTNHSWKHVPPQQQMSSSAPFQVVANRTQQLTSPSVTNGVTWKYLRSHQQMSSSAPFQDVANRTQQLTAPSVTTGGTVHRPRLVKTHPRRFICVQIAPNRMPRSTLRASTNKDIKPNCNHPWSARLSLALSANCSVGHQRTSWRTLERVDHHSRVPSAT